MALVKRKNVQYRVPEERLPAYLARGFEVVPRAKNILDKMTVAELLAYAGEHGVEVDKSANKPEILEAIRAALE